MLHIPTLSRWLALPLGLALLACEKKPEAEKTGAQATAEHGAKADGVGAPIELPPGDGPVAKVNGVDVPRDVFNREYTQTIERYQRAKHEVKPALRERLKDNIVRRLVDAEIIKQQAEKLGIAVADDEMAEKWDAHKKRYGSEEAFQAFLERAGTTADDVRRQFETNLLREKVFAKVSESVTVEAKEIREFYDQNQERYDEPEQVKASHILIRLQPQATAEEKAEKKKRVDEILEKAKKKGANFETLATEHGEDPTKDRGGDLGYFTKGRMVKPFEDAVWTMKLGEVSGVVETQFGFHIIKKTDHKKARKKPFDEVKEQIDRSLVARKRNQAIRDALNDWKEQAKIELFVQGDAAIIAEGRPTALGAEAENIVPIKRPDVPGLELKKLPAAAPADHPVEH